MPELTGPQIVGRTPGIINLAIYDNQFFLVDTATTRASYARYRAIRKQPTISLVRSIITAAIVSAAWIVESDDDATDEEVKFIRDQLFPVRTHLIERAVKGGVDFGWSPFEKVYRQDAAGMIVIDKIKPLLQDITNILVDSFGNFVGFHQPLNGDAVVPFDFALLFPFNVEGTNWYGEPIIENARDIFSAWTQAQAAAAVYDAKVVGSRLVVYYPPGTTLVDGVETPNEEIAQDIIDTLETSGTVGVPATVAKYVDELDRVSTGWKIDELSGKGAAPLLMERLKYLDVLMCRAMGMPERTVIEGAAEGQKVGTETAQRFAIQNLEMLSNYVAAVVNKGVVDQLLAWNFGIERQGKIYAVPSPIEDEMFQTLGDIAKDLISKKPESVDADEIFDHLGIPKSSEVIEPIQEPVNA